MPGGAVFSSLVGADQGSSVRRVEAGGGDGVSRIRERAASPARRLSMLAVSQAEKIRHA